MNNLKTSFLSIILVLLFSLQPFFKLNAQSANINDILDTLTIEEQFDYLFERSSRYEQYKVIREVWLNQYMENLGDTVSGLRNNIADNKATIAQKDNEISSLNESLSKTQADLDDAIKERNSFDIFGLKIDKITYNFIMWVIIAALAFLLVVGYLLYKRSHAVTREAVKRSEELQKEYDDFRNNSRLKMEKVKRDHLNEILKLKSGQ